MKFEEIKMNEAVEVNGGMVLPVIPQTIAKYVVPKVVSWLVSR